MDRGSAVAGPGAAIREGSARTSRGPRPPLFHQLLVRAGRHASWHHRPVLSFIVPAHNEARLLGATLDALHAAASGVGERYEVIVVDDDSTDATAAIARQHGAVVLPVAHRHIAATRNAGARLATGEALFFVDADTVIDAAVVGAALQALREGAAGGGAAVGLRGDVAAHERSAAGLFAWLFRVMRIAPGCFIFCTRAAFDAAGGFDQAYYAGEDVAISRALAKQGQFVILRHTVMTSARKLRTFSVAEHLRLVGRFLIGGRRVLTSRRDLALWYGERRDEP